MARSGEIGGVIVMTSDDGTTGTTGDGGAPRPTRGSGHRWVRMRRVLGVALLACVLAGGWAIAQRPKPSLPEPFGDLFQRKMVLTAPMPKHAAITYVAVSPDERFIAAGNVGPGRVTLWDARSREVKWQLDEAGFHFVVAFSRDSRYLITTSVYRSKRPIRAFATLYDVETAAPVADLKWPNDISAEAPKARRVAVDPMGEQLAVDGGFCSEIFIYETTRWAMGARWRIPGTARDIGCITALEYSPDGSMLAVGTQKGMVVFLDRAGSVIHSFKAHEEWVEAIAFRPDGNAFLTSSWSGDVNDLIKLWRTNSFMLANIQYSRGNNLDDITFDSTGDYAITSAEFPEIFSFTQDTPIRVQRLPVNKTVRSVRAMGHCFVMDAGDRVEVWCRGEK